MKERVKFDTLILAFVIILTGCLVLFDSLYIRSKIFDNALDCLGLITVLKGNFLRMSARGHKKAHSQRSQSLVTSGPYALIRNPMYFGSFLMGAGFVLIVWPWWTLILFSIIFYMRFNKQVVKEEALLAKEFGDQYKMYCEKVPRIFPSLKGMNSVRTKDVFNVEEAFSTKEKKGIWLWPVLAYVLESIQELLVFGLTDFGQTAIVFTATIVVFITGFWIAYKVK